LSLQPGQPLDIGDVPVGAQISEAIELSRYLSDLLVNVPSHFIKFQINLAELIIRLGKPGVCLAANQLDNRQGYPEQSNDENAELYPRGSIHFIAALRKCGQPGPTERLGSIPRNI